jgi:hypothetical protein
MPIRLAQVSPKGSGATLSARSTHGVLLSQPARHFVELQQQRLAAGMLVNPFRDGQGNGLKIRQRVGQ